jgi:phosphoserine phosphatase RsbU/P
MSVVSRQVRFPLKLKLLGLMATLITLSLVVFVSIALKIFKEDKNAYIYETILNKASAEKLIIGQHLRSQSPDSSEQFFEVAPNQLLYGGMDTQQILQNKLKEDSIFEMKLIVPHKDDFYQWQQGKISPVTTTEKDFLSFINSKSLHQAVREITLAGNKWLYAYDYDPQANFALVVSLPQEKAFAVTAYLINKSTYYGLFILGIALVLSVLLIRPLTAQLEKLFAMTQEIANGNFSARVALKGRDEVGALSDSINHMADKIVGFIEEMKEKARLESEVAVAQLVQSSFFPRPLVIDPVFEIYGHFEPASECGGDWWGISEHDNWKIIFIADATGHGVPAALLTATINSCKSSLNFIMENRPDMKSRPDEILRFMNQAVCGAGKEIQVTCFVACLNRQTKELVFANSSHTPPILFSSATDEIRKEDFHPLLEGNGPRLGEKIDAVFNLEKISLKTHDTIIFYTDGLTEAENNEGARWGERRLLKSLSTKASTPPEKMIAGVMADFKQFTSGHPKNDDLTIVAMKVIA